MTWVLAALCLPATAAADPGPPLTEPAAALRDAVTCAGNPRSSARTPVLLVHGTGATSAENWDVGYKPALLRRGHAVCTVDLPNFGYGDVQRSVEYVVAAIRDVNRRAGRRISIVGQSQGGFQPVYALRVWPDLGGRVDDFVGLAGVYDRGTEDAGSCATEGCVPAAVQLGSRSRLLTELARRPLPAGPSFTAIGTLTDDTVTPQPQANALPGGKSMQIQDLCPGRDIPGNMDHILMAGDAAAYALALDALDHRGPAEVGRADRAACAKNFFDDVDYVRLAQVAPAVLTRSRTEKTRSEPTVRCFMRAACKDIFQRGRMVTTASARRRGRTIRVVLRAQSPGLLRVRLARVRVKVRVSATTSRATLTLRTSSKRRRIAVETLPAGYTAWARERTLTVARRR